MEPEDFVLIVGGAGGIGAALAESYGDRAAVWSRRGGVDAADPAALAAATAELVAARGVPWGLVHTVGDFVEQPLLSTASAVFADLLRSNLTSVFETVRAVVPHMVDARRGRVVLFAAAGVDTRRAMTRAPVYFACKAAVVQLARSLAAEVAPAGVTVNVVSPGLIEHPHSHRESQGRMLARVPVGRLGGPGDVVGLVGWLLSAAAGYVTGGEFTVDGGLSL